MKKIETLEDLARVLKLMDAHHVDTLEMDGLKVTKSVWSLSAPGASAPGSVVTDGEDPSDEDLFWSSDD